MTDSQMLLGCASEISNWSPNSRSCSTGWGCLKPSGVQTWNLNPRLGWFQDLPNMYICIYVCAYIYIYYIYIHYIYTIYILCIYTIYIFILYIRVYINMYIY